jgi:enoyl-CoA hydratase
VGNELITSVLDGVLTLTINRERSLNAIDPPTLAAMRRALRRSAEDAEVCAVVITGAGQRAFSAGDDLKALAGASRDVAIANTQAWLRVGEEIEEHPCPVLAAIEGYALGGGLELAMACDYRIAGSEAKLGLPEVSVGAIPSGGGIFRLPAIVGPARARELIMFGRRLNAATALEWGLVSEVVPVGTAADRARELAAETIGMAPRSTFARVKGAMVHSVGVPRSSARYISYLTDSIQLSSPDFDEGVAGFIKKGDEQP